MANADEQAAMAAEAQYQKLEQEYQQQQEQQQKKKTKPKPKPAPAPHPTPTPTPTAPAPPKPPKQVQKALQDVADTVVRVAQTAYQVFVQPVISAVTHCISQPSAGSCLQAAATIALALIPELRAEEAGAAAAEDVSLPDSGPIARSLSAASRPEQVARTLGLNINSPTTRQLLNNLDMPVEDFIAQYD